jgi:hypothetical protein
MNLPLIPQKDHRKTKYHPQNGAPNVVHDGFFLEEDKATGVAKRERRLRLRVSLSAGRPAKDQVEEKKLNRAATGSIPPSHHG